MTTSSGPERARRARRRLSRMYRQVSLTPFESAVAALLIISGIAALAHYQPGDPVSALLPPWEAASLSVISVLTGVLLVAGCAAPHDGIERAGLLFLLAVILSRFLLYGAYLGYGTGFAVSGVFDATVAWAAVARLGRIRDGLVVRLSDDHRR